MTGDEVYTAILWCQVQSGTNGSEHSTLYRIIFGVYNKMYHLHDLLKGEAVTRKFFRIIGYIVIIGFALMFARCGGG